MKKALITGANGFIGGALARELIKNGIEVIAVDLENHNMNLPKEVRFIPHDFSENISLSGKISDRDIDVFYHLAWMGSSGSAAGGTDFKIQLRNVQWTLDCLHAAKEINCKRFVCAGSIMEHETIAAAYRQGNKPGKGYIYGSAKLAAHTMCMSEAAAIGIDLVWAKITNTYGAGEFSPRFINTTIRKIINNEPLQFTSGTQNYDFVYIDDTVRAFRLIGENGKPFHHYLIGSSCAKPLKEFILEIKNTVAPDKEFVFGDVPYTGANLPIETFDCSLTEKDTGFKAEISFAKGIKKTMDWLRTINGKTVN